MRKESGENITSRSNQSQVYVIRTVDADEQSRNICQEYVYLVVEQNRGKTEVKDSHTLHDFCIYKILITLYDLHLLFLRYSVKNGLHKVYLNEPS